MNHFVDAFPNTLIKAKLFLILASIAILLSWLTPNHYAPWLTSHSEFSVFFALLMSAVTLFFSLNAIKISKKYLFFIILAIIPLMQFSLGKIYFFGDALIASIYIVAFFVALIVGYNISINSVLDKKEIFVYFCSVLIISSIVSVMIALLQWLILTNNNIFIADLSPNARPFANFAQSNTLATFLCMGVMASLYLYEKSYINKFCGILLASFILFGIALTQSRTVWVFILAFLVWWFWKTAYFQTRLRKWSVFYFVAIYSIFIIALPYISTHLGGGATSDVISRATTGYLRIPMWHQMLVAIKNEPLWGYGWNQVSVAQLTVYLDYPTTEWIEHSHNILLDLLIWNGIPVGLLIIAFLVWWLYRLSMLATSIEPFIALSMVGVVLVHAMLEFPLEYAFFLFPVGFLLGLVQVEDKNIKVMNIPRIFLGLFLGFSIVLYSWIFIEYRIIEKDVQLVRFESLNIGKIHADHAAPNIVLLTQLREQIRFIRTPPTANMSQEQLDWMRQVTYRYATSAALYRYAQALALNNYPELAKKHLLIIEKLHGKKFSFESLYQVNHSLAFEWQNVSASKP